MTHPTGYSRTQILLHWLIALLVVLQFVLHDPIALAWRQIKQGIAVDFDPLITFHVVAGIAVLVFAVWRIGLRLKRGAPRLPENEPMLLKTAARGTHFALYALMILLPVSGAVAWFGTVDTAAEIHEAMKPAILVLVGLHVAGAIFQQVVLKTRILSRMTTPQ